jgi:hypothetical protein
MSARGCFTLGVCLWVSSTLAGCAGAAPSAAPETALLPSRVRKLSNVEYERAAAHLLGIQTPVAGELPPDERQDGYTINERQALTSHHAAELARVATRLAELAVARNLQYVMPCRPATPAHASCIDGALSELSQRAFRRPATETELGELAALYAEGAAGASVAAASSEGLKLVLFTLLTSPSFIYLSEIGAGTPIELTPYEIASSLAYSVSGAPPDAELLALAGSTSLSEPNVREAQARRLLALSSTRRHFQEFVLQWLEVDQLEHSAKAGALHPNYERYRSEMLRETRAFVDEVMVHGGASLRSLLTAGFTSLPEAMADYYGIPGFYGPRVTLSAQRRVGVLQQASFLSAHAHEDVTSPVKRGDFVLRRVLCVDLPRPGEVGIETVMPPPAEAGTTRDRFAAHTASRDCRVCHDSIDPIGFAFERFDAAGRYRTTENGQPIDTRGEAVLFNETLRFADSAELLLMLGERAEPRRCFARHALRYLTGRRSAEMESWFEGVVEGLPPEHRENLLEWVVAWVRSPEFVRRRAPG